MNTWRTSMNRYRNMYIGRKLNRDTLLGKYQDKLTFSNLKPTEDVYEFLMYKEEGKYSGDVHGFTWTNVEGVFEEYLDIAVDTNGYICNVSMIGYFRYGDELKSKQTNIFRQDYSLEAYFDMLDEVSDSEDRIFFSEKYIGKKISKTYSKTLKKDRRFNVYCGDDYVNIYLNSYGPLKVLDSNGNRVEPSIKILFNPKSEIENVLVYAKSVNYPEEKPVDFFDFFEKSLVEEVLEQITTNKKEKKTYKTKWTCFYWIKYGKNDYSERTEFEIEISLEEAKILDILNDVQNEGLINKKYQNRKVADFQELSNFVQRVKEYAEQSAYADMLNVSKKEANKIKSGGLLVGWDYGCIE